MHYFLQKEKMTENAKFSAFRKPPESGSAFERDAG
jgi:hypothetical protein